MRLNRIPVFEILLHCIICLACIAAIVPREELNRPLRPDSEESSQTQRPPHIVFVLVDDWGTYDASFRMRELGRTPQFNTPNIDAVAGDSIRLDNYYVQPICSPTRSQLLSGRYQIHTGLQHDIIGSGQPNGIPLNFTLMPEVLRDQLNYSTAMLGKWHVGFFEQDYCPWRRGFDTYLGYLTGSEDYNSKYSGKGIDFRNGSEPCNSTESKRYSTELYSDVAESIIRQHDATKPLFLYVAFQAVHEPMEAPEYYTQPYNGTITDPSRLAMAGMVSALDSAIGNITNALKDQGMWNNTIFVMSNDNGGLSQGYSNVCYPLGNNSNCGGLNYPYRGYKSGYWEGGIRGTGLLRAPMLDSSTYRYQGMFHVSDWYPTLVSAAGASVDHMGLDGVNQWDAISREGSSVSLYTGPRREILHNIDPLFNPSDKGKPMGNAVLRYLDWKLTVGRVSQTYYSSDCLCDLDSDGAILCTDCDLPEAQYQYRNWDVRLYNVTGDTRESNDLAGNRTDIVEMLLKKMVEYNNTAVPVYYPPKDPESDPDLHGGFWGPWR